MNAVVKIQFGEDLISEFLERYKSEDTKNNYKQGLVKFFGSEIVSFNDLKKVTTPDALRYVKGLFKNGLKPGTVGTYIAPLKVLWNYVNDVYELGLKNPWVSKSVIDLIKLNSPKNNGLPHGDILEGIDIKIILESDLGIKDKLIVALGTYTAMRRMELHKLNWDDIKTVDGIHYFDIEGKGRKQRYIPIVPELMELLNEYKKYYGNAYGGNILGYKDKGSISDRVRIILRKLGIKKDVSCHGLRHTALTNVAMNGGNVYQIMTLAGHSKMETSQKYIHKANMLKNSGAYLIRY